MRRVKKMGKVDKKMKKSLEDASLTILILFQFILFNGTVTLHSSAS